VKRPVLVDEHDLGVIDEAMQALFRAHRTVNAVALGSVCLRLRRQYAALETRAFRCEPDESAGLAEVVELHDYAKRVGA
jgi:hypothetical protein